MLAGDVDLSPLRARLLDVARPDRIMIWLSREHVRRLLRGLATGSLPLRHEALDEASPRTAAEHLRGLLVAAALLPTRDEYLALFERWVSEHLDGLAATDQDRKILQQFATWELRDGLVARSQKAKLRYAQVTNTTQKLRVAAGFLTWLRSRGQNLATCTQADLDEWFTTPPTTRAHARRFLRWALRTRHCPKLILPRRAEGTHRVLDHTQRIEILQRLLSPETGRLEHRVGAVLLVLFGQPFSKIAALKTDDVILQDAVIGIRLGQGPTPTPIPEPFASMLLEFIRDRPHLNTATNPASPWLFPGQRAGSHLTEGTLRTAANRMGIDLVAARTAALRQLVLDCPAPVIADMLGYSYPAIDHHALQAGSPWTSYAAIRSRSGGGH